MTDLVDEQNAEPTQKPPAGTAVLSTSNRTQRVDDELRLLANRRRRYCLYYLHRSNEPLAAQELAALVEEAVTPPGESLTEPTLRSAIHRFLDVHLSKLQAAGFVQVRDGRVELRTDSVLPVLEYLDATAAAELDDGEPEATPRDRRSTEHSV